jgi:hypothetical protein
LRRRDRSAWQKYDELSDLLRVDPEIGYELEDEWTGYRAIHIGNDRYRVIWRIDPPEEDYERPEGSQVIPVIVVRIGPKTSAVGVTIYDIEPPPPIPGT